MPTYKTPGVYVEEISTLPASVAEVETAIPAFIGYTEKAEIKGKPLINVPHRISSLLDYEMYFGGSAKPRNIIAELDNTNAVKRTDITPKYFLYDSLRMFYENGGGECYIVSVGLYNTSAPRIDLAELKLGLAELKKFDEPTLIVIPDAVLLPTYAALGDIQQDALEQCNLLMDRFSILDIKQPVHDTDDVIAQFRNNIGVNYLKYGAAYYPWIKTTLSHDFGYSDIILTKGGNDPVADRVSLANLSADRTIVTQLDRVLSDISHIIDPFIFQPDFRSELGTGEFNLRLSDGYSRIPRSNNLVELRLRAKYIKAVLKTFIALGPITDDDAANPSNTNTIRAFLNEATRPGTAPSFSKIREYIATLYAYDMGYPDAGLEDDQLGVIDPLVDFIGYLPSSAEPTTIYATASATEESRVITARPHFQALYDKVLTHILSFYDRVKHRAKNLEELLISTNPIYGTVVNAIKQEGVVIPPSGAIAGIYASVDRNRGVWKAPANVSLSSVVGPMVKFDNTFQDKLNVDTDAGKSINAIRSFTGKGTMVWGARTLAGNDNEWRYISVRRFFNMVEESVKKSTAWAVFEPNTASTWVKVKSMVENYLTLKWREGALAGTKPEEAFFVKIGLGVTMTPVDILEGRMNIEIGIAVARPAEFIILKFSHKQNNN